MLAQFNAKHRTLGLFLNSKPTVIDKLISRNKSSILGLPLEDSGDSTSDDSTSKMGSETTTSDADTNRQVQTKRTLQTSRMAPKKKNIRKQVLGSKITPKIIAGVVPFKRKAGRPKKIQTLNSTDNEASNTSKKSINKKVCVRKRSIENSNLESNISNKEVKIPKLKRKCTLKDNETSSDATNIISHKSSPMEVKKTNHSTSQEAVPSSSPKEKKLSPKKLMPVSSRALALLNATKTHKKMPALDRWKTGTVIQGRGRPRGSGRARGTGRTRGRGLVRGRGAPYLTRSDSPIPILRNGKRRKFNDPSSLGDDNHGKKRRRLFSDLVPKNDELSDEQSSVITGSEFSYCESVSTPKGIEDINREIKTECNNCDLDTSDVPDNTTDTNSNVFKSHIETKVKTEPSTPENNTNKKNIENKKVECEKQMIKKDDQKTQLTDSLMRDSDGSFDSDATEDSTPNSKTGLKTKNRRRILEGVWVRRSTRSINLKDSDNETAAIKELLNGKDNTTKNKTCNTVGNTRYIESHDGKAENSSQELDDAKASEAVSEPIIDFTLLLEESPVKDSEIKETIKPENGEQQSGSSVERIMQERVENKKVEKQKETITQQLISNNNNTTKIITLDAENMQSSVGLKTNKSSGTSLLCLDDQIEEDSIKSVIPKSEITSSQLITEEKKYLEFEKNKNNANNIAFPVKSVNKIQVTEPVILNKKEGFNTNFFKKEKVYKSSNEKESCVKNNMQKESLKQNIPLSTSEIETILTSEIDSPVKVEKICQMNNDTPHTKSIQFDSQTDDIVGGNSDVALTEILGSSISLSEFANIPFSSLDDTSNPLEQVSDILNEDENCRNTNLFDSSEDVCPDEKILSLIDSFCHESDEQLELGTSTGHLDVSNYKMNQDSGSEENVIALVIEGIVQSVLDKEHRKFKDILSNDLDEKSKESLNTDVDNYFPFTQFDNGKGAINKPDELNSDKNKLDIRASVDSKLNMDIEDKDEDMLKPCESTEESSSTDSNSHLMDLIGDPPIESMQLSGSHEDISQSEYLHHRTEEIKEEGNFGRHILPSNVETKNEKQCLPKRSNSSLLGDIEDSYKEDEYTLKIEETPEERANKESILNALGLQSLRAMPEEKPKRDSYTGTLKAVIKLNRTTDKKSGGHKIIFKQGEISEDDPGSGGDRLEYRICSEPEASTEGVPLTHLGDIASLKKLQVKPSKQQFDLSSSPNIVGAQTSAPCETGVAVTESKDGAGAKESSLVIPEKSSSFSIHPGRLCLDVCCYCFGKFGSLDTPCHLAQLKNAERLNKILSTETHLAVDSCLCDGCFRYVDRKANCPTSKSHSRKPGQRRGPLSGTSCSVQGCTQSARHSVRRKWLIKLKKSIAKKLVIDMDKNPHLPFPLCSQHYYWVDYFTVCGICKKRLTRNHMYALGPEAEELNLILTEDGIPVRLSDKLFLCKLCRYYSSLRLKYRDPSQMTPNHKFFFQGYRKKILQYHDVPVSDSEEDGKSVPEEDSKSLSEASKPKKKKSKSKSIDGQDEKKQNEDKSSDDKQETRDNEKSSDSQMIDYSYLETLGMNPEMPDTPTVDYSALAAYEGQECVVGFNNIASLLSPLEGGQGTVYPSSEGQNRSRVDVKPTRIQVKFGNLNIGKLSNLNIGQDTRQGNEARCQPANPDRPAYLPGERDLKLNAEFDFHGLQSPNVNWERCTSTIQFDSETKKLWQDLQRPYGNQSSFLRHLLILEKHWRAGSLVYSEKPDPRAVKYITSVQNRVQAYEGGSYKPNIPPPPPAIPLSIASPIVTPPATSTSISLPSSQPPPLLKLPESWPQNFIVPTTQIVRPVGIQRFPVINKTSAAVGPRPRKPNYNVGGGRGVGRPFLRSPGPVTFQQLKKLQMQKAMQNENMFTQKKPEESVQSNSSQRSTPSPSPQNTFVPLISDVRSLATTSTSWNESFKNSYQHQTRHLPPILPKIPKALTVTQIVQPTPSLLLRNTSLTIEKASNPTSKPVAVLSPEKPSISVFREPTPNGNV